MTEHPKNNLLYYTYPHLNTPHFISTRLGGASQEPYTSLNLGLHVGDHDKNVLQNRKHFMETLGQNLNRVVLAHQTHSDHIRWVTDEDAGKGAFDLESSLPDTDALVTNSKGLVLAVNVADCVPVLLYAEDQQIVAAIHAGWRGTYEFITLKTVQAMLEKGCDPAHIYAGIGPGICHTCYEVDQALFEKFSTRFGDAGSCENSSYHLDLPHINRQQLRSAGIPQSHIQLSPFCTSCDNDRFFSHRKEKGSGRFWAGIWLT